jgi:putative MATE family efflux protein
MKFTKKQLWLLIFPLLIQQLLAVTIGLADSMMVSSAGEAAVAGVSLVNSLDILLITLFSALAAGGAIITSQFIGKGDLRLANKSAKQLLYVTVGVATVISVVIIIIRVPLLDLIFGEVEAAVMENALSYFFFLALSFPFLALYDSGAAVLRSMGKSTVSMLCSVLMNLINVAGNALFIFGFGLGAAGAALGTLISRIIGSLVMTVIIHNKNNPVHIEKIFSYKPDGAIIRGILVVGIPGGLENSMFQFGKLLTQSLISTMGTAAIAANSVGHMLATFQYMPGQAISLATVTVVGQCIGAHDKKQATKYARILIGITYVALWVMCLMSVLCGKWVIGIYNVSAQASDMAFQLILYHSLVAALIWPIAFTLPGSFRSASDVRFPLIISALSMWIFRVGTSYFLALESVNVFGLFSIKGFGLGVLGVWIAMTLDWVFRAILFAWRHLSGRWLTKYRDMKQAD